MIPLGATLFPFCPLLRWESGDPEMTACMWSHRKSVGGWGCDSTPDPLPPHPVRPCPSATLSSTRPPHLFVSYFDDECFCAGQVAGPEPQPHPPHRLPAEEQQRDPRHHPDHDVIAYDPPGTATVAAEPLRGDRQALWGRGAARAGRKSGAGPGGGGGAQGVQGLRAHLPRMKLRS